MTKIEIREAHSGDVPAFLRVLDATGLFPSEMLPDMIAPSLAGETPDFWLTACLEAEPVGFCFVRPEEMTDGTWNLLAIAVSPDLQRGGAGRALIAAVEERLRREGQRLLLIDTSGAPEFDGVHSFYRALGFYPESRIRDYWAAGDDKVTFSKAFA